MILAQYRNPPFRSPTPRANNSNHGSKASSHSPPPRQSSLERRSQSPKRKRDESITEANATAPTMLTVATAISHEDAAVESGSNSPRTKVADKFKGLEVHDIDGLPGSSQSPRKKLKLVRDVSTPRPETSSRELGIPDSEGPSLLEMASQAVEESDVAPSPSTTPVVPAVPSHRRTLSKVPSLVKESSYLSTREALSPPPSQQTPTSTPQQPLSNPSPPAKRRLSSPPPPPPSSTLESMTLEPAPHDASNLTWQISEITGHDIDASNPDDDGEGINGIGFKPTPAMAHARSLKRKKQVEEWKSREAREARQRRFERRKRTSVAGGGSQGDGDGGAGEKRTVRFAEA